MARLLALLAALVVAAPAVAQAAQPSPGKVSRAVTVDGMTRHLVALQRIAEANDGNRAAGTPGYDASRDYVVAQLRKAGYRPRVQTFSFQRWTELAPSTLERTAPTATPFESATVEYSAAGDVTATAVPVAVSLTPPRASTSGCTATDFAGFPAGSVALVQRGDCTISDKADNATAAGASAVIVFNQGDSPEREGVFEVSAGSAKSIPVVTTTFAAGAELAAGGQTVRVHTQARLDTVPTSNVIADLPGRNPDRVVALGAHLDSVAEGPGINDDGTGVAFLLELAAQSKRLGLKPAQPLRFGFWGAEEAGLYGSQAYADSLTPAQAMQIAGYLNFDMLGSPNGLRMVYDGDGGGDPAAAGPPGSVRIEKAFLTWFGARDLPTVPTALDGRSDYEGFAALNIPVGGLFSGAEEIKTEEQWRSTGGIVGVATDPNYHTVRDRLSNINATIYRQLARAGAFVAVRLAQEPALLPPRQPPAPE